MTVRLEQRLRRRLQMRAVVEGKMRMRSEWEWWRWKWRSGEASDAYPTRVELACSLSMISRARDRWRRRGRRGARRRTGGAAKDRDRQRLAVGSGGATGNRRNGGLGMSDDWSVPSTRMRVGWSEQRSLQLLPSLFVPFKWQRDGGCERRAGVAHSFCSASA